MICCSSIYRNRQRSYDLGKVKKTVPVKPCYSKKKKKNGKITLESKRFCKTPSKIFEERLGLFCRFCWLSNKLMQYY
jgi:hypothetical protein